MLSASWCIVWGYGNSGQLYSSDAFFSYPIIMYSKPEFAVSLAPCTTCGSRGASKKKVWVHGLMQRAPRLVGCSREYVFYKHQRMKIDARSRARLVLRVGRPVVVAWPTEWIFPSFVRILTPSHFTHRFISRSCSTSSKCATQIRHNHMASLTIGQR